MAESPRLDEFRRRLREDPASIVFAQLAEEHRRAGDHQAAVRICRAGLARHPGYLSARVTLGRALLDLTEYDAARAEFEHVLRYAPDNLLARRCLTELDGRRHGTAPPPAPADPVLQELEGWLSRIMADRREREAAL